MQYLWSKGEEVTYRLVQQTTTTVSGLPSGFGEMNVEISMSQVLRTLVDDVAADGTATLTYVYESMRWEVNSPIATMTFDSAVTDQSAASAVPGPMKEALSGLIGESFVIVMSRYGQVMKVDANRLMEKMLKGLPPDPTLAPLLEGFKKSFSDDNVRGIFAQGHVQFPDRSLKPGDTWEQEQSMTNPIAGRLTTTTVFTLKAIDTGGGNRVARIATTLTMKSDPSAGTIAPMGLKMQLGDSSGEGELVFDIVRGRLLRSNTRTTTPMQMSMPGPDGSGMNMKTVATSVITIELLQPPIVR